ncbi:MAG: hypothetical protein GY893_07305 [bacterium]|nr:hypothetical protein [bacterium]
MRPMHRFLSLVTVLSLVLICSGAFSLAVAEEDSFDSFEDETVEDVAPAHHSSLFAVSIFAQHLIPIHILKQELYDINDLTGGGFGIGGEFKVHPMENLALSFGTIRGGMPIIGDKPDDMALINDGLRLNDTDLTADAFIQLDGFYLSLINYLGNRMMPGSKFNPYLKTNLLYMDWALLENGRGSNIMTYSEDEIVGNDFGAAFGIGTEYDLTSDLKLDWSTTWTYVTTGDEIKWEGFQHENNSFMWTNTHFWNMNLGLVYGF